MTSQIKPLPLLAGAIAFSLSLASTLPAFSQSTEPSTPTEQNRMLRHRNWLNLTPDQQARMEQIRRQEQSQIDAILTAEQKELLQRDQENRETPRAGERRGMLRQLASLNLTTEQRSRIEAVMRSSREQMDAILTPEQRQQKQQHRQQHQQRR